jgi:drug/metabolite transporter (DMT)-like permease
MSTLNLYALATLIWGSTWLAITFQLGVVAPAVSVVWRFALSALILFGYALWRQLPLRFAARDHIWLAVQGFFMFGLSYVCVYISEQTLTSGLVAVVFSIIVFWNIIGTRLFFGTPINPVTLFAAALGVAGVVLVFWTEIANFSTSGDAIGGLAFALTGTIVASCGNLAALRNHVSQIPIVQQMAWAMLYGTLFIASYAVASGDTFSFDWSFAYVLSLLYLAVFGSVVAFGLYLTLIKRIGVDRAGYVGVAIPIVALLLSTLFEDLRWDAFMVLGVLCCVVGNVLILRGKRAGHADTDVKRTT